MTRYTFGGSPSAVLTTATGDVVPNYPVIVRIAGTGEAVTALYELNGNPISELRSNPSTSAQPGAIRPFQTEHSEIEYEYLDAHGTPIRWYEAGREVASLALAEALDSLSKSEGGDVNGHVNAVGGLDVAGGLDVTGGATVDELAVEGAMSVGGVFTAGALSLAGMRLFNPRIYGATGNGTTDDAPAVQAALSAAAGAGGGWVIVPPGTYRLATLPVRIYRNTRLTLMPGAVFVRGANQTLLLNGDADQAYGGYTGHGNIMIEGGRWEMQATAAGLTASRMCISLGHAQNIVVRNVEVRDVPGFHGIELNACKNVIIDGCRFLGYVDPGGRSTSEAVQMDLAAGSGYFGGFGPYDFTPCEDITVRDCYVGASGTAGTTAWPRGVGSHSSIIDRWHRRIKVLGCTFDGVLLAGVRTYAWEDVTVAECIFRSCGMGVQHRTVDTTRTADTVNAAGVQTNASQNQWGLVVSGCQFVSTIGGEDGAIFVQGEATGRCVNVSITGNVIRIVGNAKSGIRLAYVYRATVSGNTIQGVGGTAISQDTVEGAVITGNKIHDALLSGVSGNTCTDMLITSNNITVCGLNGIHIVTGLNTKISDNYVRGVGRTDGNGFGYRITTNSVKTTLTNNTYVKFGSGNEAANALSITSGNTGIRRWGNDWIGQGRLGDVADVSSPNLSPYDSGA